MANRDNADLRAEQYAGMGLGVAAQSSGAVPAALADINGKPWMPVDL